MDAHPAQTAPASAPEHRDGYALLGAVVVMIVIVLIGAAVAMPMVATAEDQRRVAYTRDLLEYLTDEPNLTMERFNDNVNTWPGALSHLSTPITTSDEDICGKTYPNGRVGNWEPWVDRMLPQSGTPTGIGIANDTLEHQTITGVDYIAIVIPGVDLDDAERFERRVDATFSSTDGRVRWSAADAEGVVTVRWLKEFDGCGGGGGGGGPPGQGPGA